MDNNKLPNEQYDLSVVAQADGQAVDNGAGVDMQGFEGVMFIAAVGAITGAGDVELKAQGSSDDAVGDAYADLEGSAQSLVGSANGDKLIVLDIERPQERYVRPVVSRTVANAVLGGVVAIRYRAKKAPTTQGATVGASKQLTSPDEGTA